MKHHPNHEEPLEVSLVLGDLQQRDEVVVKRLDLQEAKSSYL